MCDRVRVTEDGRRGEESKRGFHLLCEQLGELMSVDIFCLQPACQSLYLSSWCCNWQKRKAFGRTAMTTSRLFEAEWGTQSSRDQQRQAAACFLGGARTGHNCSRKQKGQETVEGTLIQDKTCWRKCCAGRTATGHQDTLNTNSLLGIWSSPLWGRHSDSNDTRALATARKILFTCHFMLSSTVVQIMLLIKSGSYHPSPFLARPHSYL